MNRGFKDTVDFILRKYGLKTRDCVGTVWSDGDWSWLTLNAMGYRVEKGITNPDYDYVILSKGKSTVQNVFKALTVVKTGCIIIFRADGNEELVKLITTLYNLRVGLTFSYWLYSDNKVLGVLFKGKEF